MATNTYSAEVLINSAKASRSLDETRKSSDELNKSLSSLYATIKGGQGDLNAMAKTIGSLSATVAEARKASQDFANAKIAESKAVAQASKAIDSSAIDNATSSTRALAGGIDETAAASGRLKNASPAKSLNESAKASDNFGNSLANQRYLLYDIGATYRTLAIAAQAIPAASVAAASAYERDFAQVMRVTGQTTQMSQGLRAELKQLGSEIPLSFSELSNIAQIGGQMDVPAEQLGKFTETVARFVATADGATIDSTTQAFGRMANLFNTGDNFDPEFFNRLGSAISMTADNAVTSEAKIISMLDKLAPVAKQAGLSATEVTAFASALSSVGLAPEISSGFFTRFFGQLNKDVAAGSARLETYASTLGMTVSEFKELYATNPSDVLQGVAQAMSRMDKVSATSLLGELGVRATRDQRVLAGLSESYHVLEQAMGDVESAYAKASYLEATSEGIFGTFASNLKELGNAVMNLGDSIGAGPLAVLNSLAEGVTGFVQATSALLDQVPALRGLLGVLLNMASIAGIIFAAKSALSFLTASMVAFQQATQSGLTKTMNMRGSLRTLATTMLAARGATDQTTQSLLRQQGALGALRVATTTTNASIEAMNAGQAGARTAALRSAGGWKTAGTALMSFAGGPLALAVGALGFLTTAWYTASQEAKRGAQEVVRAFAQADAAGAEALATAFATDKAGMIGASANLLTVGKSYQELANIAGVSMEDISRALAGGKEDLDAYIATLEEQRRVAKETYGNFGQGADISPALGNIIEKLKGYSNELQVADDIAKGTAEAQEGLAGSTDMASDAFAAGSEDVANWAQSLNDAVAQAFGFIDAQGALAAAMEKLGGGLVESPTFSTDTSGGRDNLANLQATLQAQALLLQQQLTAQEISGQAAAESYSQFAQSLMNEIVNMGGGVSEEVQQVVNSAVASVQDTFNEQHVEVGVSANIDQFGEEISTVFNDLHNFLQDNTLTADIELAGAPETVQTAYDTVQYISDLTGMPFEAVVMAFTDPASSEATQVATYMQELMGMDYRAVLDADTSTAVADVQRFSSWANSVLGGIGGAIFAAGNAMDNIPGYSGVADAVKRLGSGLMSKAVINTTPIDAVAKSVAQIPPAFKKAATASKDAGKTMQQSAKLPKPDLDGLGRGYDNARKKAGGAGKAGKKAGNDAAKGSKKASDAVKQQQKDWDELEQQISGYASRVGTAFGYVTARQTGVAEAKDEYYSILNGIKERLEQQKQTVRELRAENKALNSERRVQLNDAAKLEKMAGYADQMGNTERAKYYRDEAKALKDSAAETKLKIDANNKEAKSIEKGIGNLKGYTKEAIENRKELRNLRDASLAVAEAYAKSGASAKTVAAQTKAWTDRTKTHSRQLGYTAKDVQSVIGKTSSYINILKRVPKTVNTNLNARNNTASGVNAARRAIGSVPSSRTTSIGAKTLPSYGRVKTNLKKDFPTSKTVKVKVDAHLTPTAKRAHDLIQSPNMRWRGGPTAYNSGGLVQGFVGGFASGGLIPGTPPSNPNDDNIIASVDSKGIAAIRSGEYIQSQPAVDYYGTSFMDKLNRMEIPRYALGGVVGNSKSTGNTMPSVIDLSSETIQSIARLVQKDIYLYADNLQLAQSVQRGFDEMAQRGGKF